MRYLFIVNPHAGKKRETKRFLSKLTAFVEAFSGDMQICQTQYVGHGTKIAAEAAESEEPLRIYACGGDGTLNEVVCGVASYTHVEVGCIPIGSGNDFVKNFPNTDFFNFARQIEADSKEINLLRVVHENGTAYAINAVSLSWDSRVAMSASRFKHIPFVSGKMSYIIAVIYEMIRKKPARFSLVVDGKKVPMDDYMIGLCANGGYYGGGFFGAPLADLSDDLMDLVLIKNVTRLQIIKLVSIFAKGNHLTSEHWIFKERMLFYQAKEMQILAEEDVPITIDGNGIFTRNMTVKIAPETIRFLKP